MAQYWSTDVYCLMLLYGRMCYTIAVHNLNAYFIFVACDFATIFMSTCLPGIFPLQVWYMAEFSHIFADFDEVCVF